MKIKIKRNSIYTISIDGRLVLETPHAADALAFLMGLTKPNEMVHECRIVSDDGEEVVIEQH